MSVPQSRLIWLNFLGEEAWRAWTFPWAVPWRRRRAEAWDEVGFLIAESQDVYLSRVEPHPAWRDARVRQWKLHDHQPPTRIQLHDLAVPIGLKIEDRECVFVQVSPDELKLKPDLDLALMNRLRAWNDKRSWPAWVRSQGFQTPETWPLKNCERPPCSKGRMKLAWSSGGMGQRCWKSPEEFESFRAAFAVPVHRLSQLNSSELIPVDEWLVQREIELPRRHWTVSFHMQDLFRPVAAQVVYDQEFHSTQHELMCLEQAPIELRRFLSIWRSALTEDKWMGAAGFDAIEDSQGEIWLVDLNARLDRVGLMAWVAEHHGLRLASLTDQTDLKQTDFSLPRVSRWRGLLPTSSREDLVQLFFRDFELWSQQPPTARLERTTSRVLHFGIVEAQMSKVAVEVQILHRAETDALAWMETWFNAWQQRFAD